MAIKIVQDIDVDGVTIQIKEADGQPKLVAQGSANPSAQDKNTVEFGDREVTIGDFFINGGGMVKLVFRELITNSNRMAVCTGFEFNGNWYLDRPDDGDVIDVFNNMETKEVVNGVIVSKSAPPVQPVTSAPTDTTTNVREYAFTKVSELRDEPTKNRFSFVIEVQHNTNNPPTGTLAMVNSTSGTSTEVNFVVNNYDGSTDNPMAEVDYTPLEYETLSTSSDKAVYRLYVDKISLMHQPPENMDKIIITSTDGLHSIETSK